jgi:glycosyltransferase involved in cell wall biosynthesis
MGSVSCIIVNYNNEKYLDQCLKSVLSQSRKVDEIIISDDCSTDNSLDIIWGYAKKHDNIVVIENDFNLGVAKNRDKACRYATSDFITTLDSDDYYYPEKIENEIRILEQFPDAIASSDAIDVDINGNILSFRSTKKICANKSDRRIDILINGNKKYHPKDLMYSKKTYLKVGGFNPKYNLNEDWDFKLKLAGLKTQWFNSGVYGTAYRHTGFGLSSSTKMFHSICVKLNILISYYKNSSNKICYSITLIKYFFLFSIVKLIENR